MFIIDQMANQSGLRQLSPVEKGIFSIGMLVICLVSQRVELPLLIICIISGFLLFYGKIPPRIWCQLLTLPLAFLLLGLLPLVVQVGQVMPDEAIYFGRIGSWQLYTTRLVMQKSLFLLFRSMGCVSSLYFLLLTTPMAQINGLLVWLRVPAVLQEMIFFVYRFIFLLMETGQQIYRAQDARGGYGSLRNGLGSFAQLVVMILIKAQVRGERSYSALEARGYSGQIHVVAREEMGSYSMKWHLLCWGSLVILVYGFGLWL